MLPLGVQQAQIINASNPTQYVPKPTPPPCPYVSDGPTVQSDSQARHLRILLPFLLPPPFTHNPQALLTSSSSPANSALLPRPYPDPGLCLFHGISSSLPSNLQTASLPAILDQEPAVVFPNMNLTLEVSALPSGKHQPPGIQVPCDLGVGLAPQTVCLSHASATALRAFSCLSPSLCTLCPFLLACLPLPLPFTWLSPSHSSRVRSPPISPMGFSQTSLPHTPWARRPLSWASVAPLS